MSKIILTIGHSIHPISEFLGLLKAHKIKQLADIRTIPKSRHNPQFNKDELAKSCRDSGIGYLHLKELGGLRQARKDSINLGWRNASFCGYADYMGTDEFAKAIKRLEDIAAKKRTAIMCAEAVPWRCHRSLVADALTKRKWEVFHVTSLKSAKLHKLTPFLRMRKGKIIYLIGAPRRVAPALGSPRGPATAPPCCPR